MRPPMRPVQWAGAMTPPVRHPTEPSVRGWPQSYVNNNRQDTSARPDIFVWAGARAGLGEVGISDHKRNQKRKKKRKEENPKWTPHKGSWDPEQGYSNL